MATHNAAKEPNTWLPRISAHLFVCGSNVFVNIAVDGTPMVRLDAALISTERYGG
jgi:hypothetical protein